MRGNETLDTVNGWKITKGIDDIEAAMLDGVGRAWTSKRADGNFGVYVTASAEIDAAVIGRIKDLHVEHFGGEFQAG